MKIVIKALLIFFVFSVAFSCRAQLVQTVADAKKLEINKEKFVGKPLKDLLKEIKPEIKRVRVIPGSMERLSTFYFYFLSDSNFHKSINENEKPVEIIVRTKEYNFEWNPASKPKNERYAWTKEDEKKFENLTVVDIKVKDEK